MAVCKVLAAVLVVCVAQNVAFASLFDKEQGDEFGLVMASNFLGVNPVNFLECLPRLSDSYLWVQQLKGLFREYKDINARNISAKANCARITEKAAVEKCLKDADDAMVAQKVKLFENVDKFIDKSHEMYAQFSKCLKDQA